MTDRDGFVEQSLELIGRLETAEVGSRELDIAVMTLSGGARQVSEAIFYGPGESVWYCGDFEDSSIDVPLPYVTTSLDAALALAERVLPDLQAWRVERDGHKHWGRVVYAAGLEARTADASTAPLALCLAILKARATPEGMRKPLEDMGTGR